MSLPYYSINGNAKSFSNRFEDEQISRLIYQQRLEIPVNQVARRTVENISASMIYLQFSAAEPNDKMRSMNLT